MLRTLNWSVATGTVIIITNAETGWVELSGRKYLPSVYNFVMENGIRVISARSLVEPQGFASPFEWKREVFRGEMHRHLCLAYSLFHEQVDQFRQQQQDLYKQQLVRPKICDSCTFLKNAKHNSPVRELSPYPVTDLESQENEKEETNSCLETRKEVARRGEECSFPSSAIKDVHLEESYDLDFCGNGDLFETMHKKDCSQPSHVSSEASLTPVNSIPEGLPIQKDIPLVSVSKNKAASNGNNNDDDEYFEHSTNTQSEPASPFAVTPYFSATVAPNTVAPISLAAGLLSRSSSCTSNAFININENNDAHNLVTTDEKNKKKKGSKHCRSSTVPSAIKTSTKNIVQSNYENFTSNAIDNWSKTVLKDVSEQLIKSIKESPSESVSLSSPEIINVNEEIKTNNTNDLFDAEILVEKQSEVSISFRNEYQTKPNIDKKLNSNSSHTLVSKLTNSTHVPTDDENDEANEQDDHENCDLNPEELAVNSDFPSSSKLSNISSGTTTTLMHRKSQQSKLNNNNNNSAFLARSSTTAIVSKINNGDNNNQGCGVSRVGSRKLTRRVSCITTTFPSETYTDDEDEGVNDIYRCSSVSSSNVRARTIPTLINEDTQSSEEISSYNTSPHRFSISKTEECIAKTPVRTPALPANVVISAVAAANAAALSSVAADDLADRSPLASMTVSGVISICSPASPAKQTPCKYPSLDDEEDDIPHNEKGFSISKSDVHMEENSNSIQAPPVSLASRCIECREDLLSNPPLPSYPSTSVICEFLSLGDSLPEIDALLNGYVSLARLFAEAHTPAVPLSTSTVTSKTIKFSDRPHLSSLLEEHNLLSNYLESLAVHPESIALEICVDEPPIDWASAVRHSQMNAVCQMPLNGVGHSSMLMSGGSDSSMTGSQVDDFTEEGKRTVTAWLIPRTDLCIQQYHLQTHQVIQEHHPPQSQQQQFTIFHSSESNNNAHASHSHLPFDQVSQHSFTTKQSFEEEDIDVHHDHNRHSLYMFENNNESGMTSSEVTSIEIIA